MVKLLLNTSYSRLTADLYVLVEQELERTSLSKPDSALVRSVGCCAAFCTNNRQCSGVTVVFTYSY